MFIENAVSVSELAKVLRKTEGKTVAECKNLGVHTGENWSGQPAVSTGDAHAIVSGQAAAGRERDRAWHEHQVATAAWEDARLHAYQDAASVAHDGASRQGRGGPAAHREAEAAGKAAAAKFEKTHKLPTFENVPTTNRNPANAVSVAARGEDGSTPSAPKSVSIMQTLNATDPAVNETTGRRGSRTRSVIRPSGTGTPVP